MARSILQDGKKCYFCGTAQNLHQHHIFYGSNRSNSEKYGFWVYLCALDHNMSSEGVHFNKERDLALKRECQRKYEEEHSREEFMSIIGRNYLD